MFEIGNFSLLALSWQHYAFSIPLALISVFLMLVILVQRGRGGGLTGALGGMGGQSAFGTKAGDLFTRVTIAVAAIWILLSMLTLKVLNNPTTAVAAPPPPAAADKDGKGKPKTDQSKTDDKTATEKAATGNAAPPDATTAPPDAANSKAPPPATDSAAPPATAPASAPATPPANSPPASPPPADDAKGASP